MATRVTWQARWRGTQTDLGNGTKRVRVVDEQGQVVYDVVADLDTDYRGPGPVTWETTVTGGAR